MTQQKGFAHAFLITGFVVALIGALGFIFWQDFIHKEPVKTEIIKVTSKEETNKKDNDKSPVLKDSDVSSMASAIRSYSSKCSLTPKDVSDFVTADLAETYYAEGQQSTAYQQAAKVDKTIKFANVSFGCGSQGSTAVMVKKEGSWTVLATDATVYMKCKDVDGSGVPVEIMPRCWESDMKTTRAVR